MTNFGTSRSILEHRLTLGVSNCHIWARRGWKLGVGLKICILFPIFPYTDVWEFTNFGNFGSLLDPQEPKYWFYRKMSHFKVVHMAILYLIEPKINKLWQFSDFTKYLVFILENRSGEGSKPIFWANFFVNFFRPCTWKITLSLNISKVMLFWFLVISVSRASRHTEITRDSWWFRYPPIQ